MATYNGHPSWAYWNVSLWIENDEGLYNLALECVRTTHSQKEAIRLFQEALANNGITATPDGARYSKAAIRHGMRHLS